MKMMRLICGFFQWIRQLFWSKEMEITVVGLQQAGKTTFVNVIADSQYTEDTIPTIGFNMRLVKKGKVVMKIWDLGGERRFRGMWERYCRGINAIVYVVDSANTEKLLESKNELKYLLNKPQLANVPVIVLGNKTDLPHAIGQNELIEKMGLCDFENREVCCYMVSCKNKENIDMTLRWLIHHSKYPE